MQKSLSSTKQIFFLRVVRAIREEAGLRQIDVAQRLNQPQSFVSKYEAGERRLDFLELELVCEACDSDIERFVMRYRAEQ